MPFKKQHEMENKLKNRCTPEYQCKHAVSCDACKDKMIAMEQNCASMYWAHKGAVKRHLANMWCKFNDSLSSVKSTVGIKNDDSVYCELEEINLKYTRALGHVNELCGENDQLKESIRKLTNRVKKIERIMIKHGLIESLVPSPLLGEDSRRNPLPIPNGIKFIKVNEQNEKIVRHMKIVESRARKLPRSFLTKI